MTPTMVAVLIGVAVAFVLIGADEWRERRRQRRVIDADLRALMFLTRRPVRRPRSSVGAGCSPAPAPAETTGREWS